MSMPDDLNCCDNCHPHESVDVTKHVNTLLSAVKEIGPLHRTTLLEVIAGVTKKTSHTFKNNPIFGSGREITVDTWGLILNQLLHEKLVDLAIRVNHAKVHSTVSSVISLTTSGKQQLGSLMNKIFVVLPSKYAKTFTSIQQPIHFHSLAGKSRSRRRRIEGRLMRSGPSSRNQNGRHMPSPSSTQRSGYCTSPTLQLLRMSSFRAER